MEFVAELVVTVIADVFIRFPAGLIKIWIEERRKKSFRTIIRERDWSEICAQGTVSFLNVIAAIGAVVMFAVAILGIIMLFKKPVF
jgi:hypothetical protein